MGWRTVYACGLLTCWFKMVSPLPTGPVVSDTTAGDSNPSSHPLLPSRWDFPYVKTVRGLKEQAGSQ
jgi:hypothetical protein